MTKINPTKIGFVQTKNEDDESEYTLIIKNKVHAKLMYFDMLNEWKLTRVINCVDDSTKTCEVYFGGISDVEFAKNLVINGIYHPDVRKFYTK